MTVSIDNTNHTDKGIDSRFQALTDAVNALGGGTSAIKVASVRIPAADIALITTANPYVMIAGNAGVVRVGVQALLQLKFNTTPFALSGGTSSAVRIGVGVGQGFSGHSWCAFWFGGIPTDLLTKTNDALMALTDADTGNSSGTVPPDTTYQANQPVVLDFNNDSAWTGGDSDLYVTLYYTELELQ